MENKAEIAKQFCITLQMTREYAEELDSLEYTKNGYEEIVTATFKDGYVKKINVGMDSGIAMIRDIIKGLG